MDRLKGKVAVVTGGALGLGHAMAIRMAEEGAQVAVFDVLDQEGQALVSQISVRSLGAHYWHCDVASEAEVATAINGVVTHFGRLDIFVNNAGISGTNKPTHELTEAEWDQVQSVNVKGVFFCTKHATPHLRQVGGAAS
jgi:NAD(P)-dependent dehydrogenase (short-subunit alcohol dehydrogenase family)